MAGQLDIGCMGIPPVLIAIDKGAEIKIGFGNSGFAVEVMAVDENIKSLSDFKPEDKIAVPGLISTQSIILSLASKKIFGDARKFDNNLIVMPHPEGAVALKKDGVIKGHVTSMPYIDKEKETGARSIMKANDIGLRPTNVCAVSKKFYKNNKEEYNGILKAINESMELIRAKDSKVLEIIAKTERMSVDEAIKNIDYLGAIWDTKVYDIQKVQEHMLESGYIKKKIPVEDYFWDKEIIGE